MVYYYDLIQDLSKVQLQTVREAALTVLHSKDVTLKDIKEFILKVGEEIVTSRNTMAIKAQLGVVLFEQIIDVYYEQRMSDHNLYDLVWIVNGTVVEVIQKNRPLPTILWIKSQKRSTTHSLGLLQPRPSSQRPTRGWIN